MNFLFVKAEANGRPGNYDLPFTQLDNWPRLTKLSWILADDEAQVLDERNLLVKPDGWEIPKSGYFALNNITTESRIAEGLPVQYVLSQFMANLARADVFIGHGAKTFDFPVIWSELVRAGMYTGLSIPLVCTMHASVDHCQLPGGIRGYKFPKLTELYKHLFRRNYYRPNDEDAHMPALMHSFFELVRRDVIKLSSLTQNNKQCKKTS